MTVTVGGEVGRRRLVAASPILAGAVTAAVALSACGTPAPSSVRLPTRSVASIVPAAATPDIVPARDTLARAGRTPAGAADTGASSEGSPPGPTATPWRVSPAWTTVMSVDEAALRYCIMVEPLPWSADRWFHYYAEWSDLVVVARLVEVGPRRFRTPSGRPPAVPYYRYGAVDKESTYLPIRFEVIEVVASRVVTPPFGVVTTIDYERDGMPRQLEPGVFWGCGNTTLLELPQIRPEGLYDRPVGLLIARTVEGFSLPDDAYSTAWARSLSVGGQPYTAVVMGRWWEFAGDQAIDITVGSRMARLPQSELVDRIMAAWATVTPPTPTVEATRTPVGPGPEAR